MTLHGFSSQKSSATFADVLKENLQSYMEPEYLLLITMFANSGEVFGMNKSPVTSRKLETIMDLFQTHKKGWFQI